MGILDILLHEDEKYIIVQFDSMDLKIDKNDFGNYLEEHEPEVYEMSKEDVVSDFTTSTIGFIDIESSFDYDYFLEVFSSRTIERLVKDYVKKEYQLS